MDIARGQNFLFEASFRQLLSQKLNAGCAVRFNHRITARHYIFLYNKLLRQQVFNLEDIKVERMKKPPVKGAQPHQNISDLLACYIG